MSTGRADDTTASRRGDLVWGTIPTLVTARAAASGVKPAIVDVDRTLSYDELLAESRRCAAALLACGVERGDRVAIWAPNHWRWVVAALGAHFAGATLVPINTRYKGMEAAAVLDRTAPKVLFMVGRFLGVSYPLLLADAGCSPPAGTVVTIDDTPTAGITFTDFLAHADRVGDDAVTARADEVRPDDPSDILFTSGTTGDAKGVVTDHGQNLHAYYDWSTLAGMRGGDQYTVIPPFFHAFGYKVGWLSSLMHGMTIYPHAVLEADVLTRQISERQITVLPGPPTLFQTLLDHPARPDLDQSSLRVAIIGAATIPPALVQRMKDELGFERITTCYGLTEATGVATISRADDPLDLVLTTAGRAVPDVEVGVLPEGEPEPRRTGEGEIVVRGYNVMRGYFSLEGLSPGPVDTGGWLHTGDVGTLDQYGYLRVTDRKKDLFVVGGFNVSPAEIEKVLAEHPGVAQVAVIGVPDQRLGEVGLAFVVPREGHDVDAGLVVEWCRVRLANFKVPRRIRFVDELPRNATGKVLKGELRRQAGVGQATT